MLGSAQVTARFRCAAPITKLILPEALRAGAIVRIIDGGAAALVRFSPPVSGTGPLADYAASAKTSAACSPETAVEQWPAASASTGGYSAALALSLVPNIGPASRFLNGAATEVTFVADCSGSMKLHGRMRQMKNTLQLALRSLPASATFQILAFGTKTCPCFRDGAVAYNQDSLNAATKFVAAMRPYLGGTRILSPLRVATGAISLSQLSEQGEVRSTFTKPSKWELRH